MSAARSRARLALIDYGLGNLRSVEKALSTAGAQVVVTSAAEEILQADKVVLPGVGAFRDGMDGLRQRGLVEALEELMARGTPLLGICLGMQLLFEASEEGAGGGVGADAGVDSVAASGTSAGPNGSPAGEPAGLGFLPGRVRRFTTPGLKVPQTGWNQILPVREMPLLDGIRPESYAYFNHSYYCDAAVPTDWMAAAEYGLRYACVVGRDRLYGVQFHPEKSQEVGLQILRNFIQFD